MTDRDQFQPEYSTTVEGSQGVQIGNHNQTVNNHVTWSSSDAGLERLSDDRAAAQLAKLAKADPSLERAVQALAELPAKKGGRTLRALLNDDQDLAIALLGDMDHEFAQGLVAAVESDDEILQEFLQATAAIAECRRSEEGRSLGRSAGRITRVVSGRGTQGFAQAYAKGEVYWSPTAGAVAMTGEIADAHGASMGVPGILGFPVSPQRKSRHAGTGTACTWQEFEGLRDYGAKTCEDEGLTYGASIISSEFGTFVTGGGIGEFSEADWHDEGSLGVPTGRGGSVHSDSAHGWRQRFEAGTVYWSSKTGAALVPSEMAEVLGQEPIGFPVSAVSGAAASPQGTAGRFQRFERGTLYHSESHGVQVVSGLFDEAHQNLRGTEGWLGFPIAGPPGDHQRFEGGVIFLWPNAETIAVRHIVLDYLNDHPSTGAKLGRPSGPEQALTEGGFIQRFERGFVVVQGDDVEVGLFPAALD